MKISNLILLGVGGVIGVAAFKGYEILKAYASEKNEDAPIRTCDDCPIVKNLNKGRSIATGCVNAAKSGKGVVKSGIKKGAAYSKNAVGSVKEKLKSKKTQPVDEVEILSEEA